MKEFERYYKKNEGNRKIFFQVGLIVSLSVVLIAFEWTSSETDKKLYGDGMPVDDYLGQDIINTFQKPEPKETKPLPVVERIEIVDDTEDLIDELSAVDVEAPQSEASVYVPVFGGEVEVEEDIPFINPQEMPKFGNGGLNEFWRYVQEHVKYPELAAELGIQGTVYVIFVVGKDGYVTQAKVVRSADELLDNEALRVIKNSPKWIPGKQGGKNVSVQFTIPVKFKLQ